jgi:hypothetical protein
MTLDLFGKTVYGIITGNDYEPQPVDLIQDDNNTDGHT